MLNVILGESIEHKQLFEQAAAGLEDLLGAERRRCARRSSPSDTVAGVGLAQARAGPKPSLRRA
jgi:hypothetical protein